MSKVNTRTETVSARLTKEEKTALEARAATRGKKPSVLAAEWVVDQLRVAEADEDRIERLLLRVAAIVIAALSDEYDMEDAARILAENVDPESEEVE